MLLAEIAAEFLPPGVLNVVCGDRTTGAAVVAHPTPAMVSITGSVARGHGRSPSRPPRDLKRAHLELGGKAPVMVFDDADIAAAAEGIAVAGYFNAGQDCTAATRVLVAPGVHDDFVAALTEQATGRHHLVRARQPTTRTPGCRRSTTPTSSTGCSASSRPVPDHATGAPPAASGRATAASTSSRPSSPGCSRTTS